MVCIMQTAAVASTFPSDAGRAGEYQPGFRRRRRRQHPRRPARRLPRRCQSAQHGDRLRIRRPLPDRLAHRRRADGRARAPRGGPDGLCAPCRALRHPGLHRHPHLPRRRDDQHLSPRRAGNPAGRGERRAGRGAADRDRHAARHRAVLRAQPLYRGAALLRGAGAGAGQHRVVAARPGGAQRA